MWTFGNLDNNTFGILILDDSFNSLISGYSTFLISASLNSSSPTLSTLGPWSASDILGES